jgi:ubiquinone/menaquinone biosynthesis C-methylase UbiE
MDVIKQGQVSQSAAEIYESFFLPAIFAQWSDLVLKAAKLGPGQHVLDVACGTGILARTAVSFVQPNGRVVGLDLNEGMLTVAQQKAPDVEWRLGQAEVLPFEDQSFDAVVSQFGLMFFVDRRQALAEMVRVLRPTGRLAVAVWDSLENTPGYAAVVGMLDRLFGTEVAEALRSPYVLGNKTELADLFSELPLKNLQIETYMGAARFSSIADWMFTDVRGWTLAGMIDDEQFAMLLREAEVVLRPFITQTGSVQFAVPAHILTAQKA